MFNRIQSYADLIRLDRPIGSLLLLWPTLWGLWVAGDGAPQANLLLIFICGVFVMRSAGCAINDIADRDIDKHVGRTKDRPLTSGKISLKEAFMVFFIFSGLGLCLALMLNTKAILLSIVAMCFAASYPFFKRITNLPQLFLGIAFSFSIPMAYVAQTNTIALSCWVLMLVNILWVIAYDTLYAMVDKEDDLKIGVKSTAILFKNNDRLAVLGLHLVSLLILILLGLYQQWNSYYFMVLGFTLCLMIYEATLYWRRDRALCFKAFLHNTWIGASIFVAIICAHLN